MFGLFKKKREVAPASESNFDEDTAQIDKDLEDPLIRARVLQMRVANGWKSGQPMPIWAWQMMIAEAKRTS